MASAPHPEPGMCQGREQWPPAALRPRYADGLGNGADAGQALKTRPGTDPDGTGTGRNVENPLPLSERYGSGGDPKEDRSPLTGVSSAASRHLRQHDGVARGLEKAVALRRGEPAEPDPVKAGQPPPQFC